MTSTYTASSSVTEFAFEELKEGGGRYAGPEILKARTLAAAKREATRRRLFQRTDIRLWSRIPGGSWEVIGYRYADRLKKWVLNEF